MTRRERIVNNISTDLNGAINNIILSATLTDGSIYPSEGDYRLLIDSEVVLVTARSGNVVTIVRGVDDTTAASHSDEAAVNVILTAEGMDQYIDDITAGASDRNPFRLLDLNDITLTTSDFTFINQGTSSVSDDAWGGITMQVPETVGGFRIQVKTAPSTPYTITTNFQVGPGFTWSTVGTIFGTLFRESSTGKFILNYAEPFDVCKFAKYDDPSTFNSFLSAEVDFDTTEIWQQIEDDGVDLKIRVSSDGINFFELATEARTTFLAGGPDQIGWCTSSRGEANKLNHLRAWRET